MAVSVRAGGLTSSVPVAGDSSRLCANMFSSRLIRVVERAVMRAVSYS